MTIPSEASSNPAPSPVVKNGLGTAALVCAIVGLALSWIPIIGLFGFILGILAVIFGGIGLYRANTGIATNKVMASIGTGLGGVAIVISFAVFGSFANELDQSINQPAPAAGGTGGEEAVVPPADAPPAPPEPGTIPGDGTFLVGTDVEPGTYRSSGGDSYGCYYARLSDTTGNFDAIITNGIGDGQSIVTIEPTDAAFETSGCGTWEKVE